MHQLIVSRIIIEAVVLTLLLAVARVAAVYGALAVAPRGA
jgi:hypothetical protein